MVRAGTAARGASTLSCVLVSCLVVVALAAPQAAAARSCGADEPSCGGPGNDAAAPRAAQGGEDVGQPDGAGESEPESEPEDGAAVTLEVSPVVDGSPDGGHLVTDPQTGLATLTFTPTGPAEQLAVLDHTVSNTGAVLLSEVVLVADGTGAPVDVGPLAPGEARVVRVGRTFTFEQVAGGLAGVLDQGATVTGRAEGDVVATAAGTSPLQLVAVLASPRLGLVKQVVAGAGDVTTGVDGTPVVTWSARAATAGEARLVRFRLRVTNLGTTVLHDLDVVDPMLDAEPLPVDSGDQGLAPGASTVLEVDHLLDPHDVLPAGPLAGWVEEDVRNVAVARGRDAAGVVVAEATAEAVLRVRAAPTAGAVEVLPAAGPGAAPGLFTGAMLFSALGAVALRGTRQRRS